MTGGAKQVMRILAPHQLPAGFPTRLTPPDTPVPAALPAATVVLLREGREDLEVLLLERSLRSRFIPGAFVFPGGRVDRDDTEPEFLEQSGGLESSQLRRESNEEACGPSALAFRIAALRETFEETGVLLARVAGSGQHSKEVPHPELRGVRADLLKRRISFLEAAHRIGVIPDASNPVYFANWVTPESEPRRFDTRFFAAQLPPDAVVTPFKEEVTRALWLTPVAALKRNAEGTLPLVFPTLRTLETLREFSTPSSALHSLAKDRVPKRLPELHRVPGGIGVVLRS